MSAPHGPIQLHRAGHLGKSSCHQAAACLHGHARDLALHKGCHHHQLRSHPPWVARCVDNHPCLRHERHVRERQAPVERLWFHKTLRHHQGLEWLEWLNAVPQWAPCRSSSAASRNLPPGCFQQSPCPAAQGSLPKKHKLSQRAVNGGSTCQGNKTTSVLL